jgi:chemotaxis protein MotB
MRGSTTIAVLAFCGLLFGGCVSQAQYEKLEKRYVDREAVVSSLNATLDQMADQLARANLESQAKEALLRKREEELALVSQVRTKIDDEWKKQVADSLALFGKDDGVSVDRKTGALVLEGSVFFDSGQAVVKESARKTLLKVAKVLKNRGAAVQIVGHTDSDPVSRSKERWPQGNLELSGARALNVLVFLRDEGGVPESLLTFAGCGPNQPRTPGSTEADKKQNRRVEILVKSPGSE